MCYVVQAAENVLSGLFGFKTRLFLVLFCCLKKTKVLMTEHLKHGECVECFRQVLMMSGYHAYLYRQSVWGWAFAGYKQLLSSHSFKVFSTGSLTVSHFLQLSSICAGFVLFWEAYSTISYLECPTKLLFSSIGKHLHKNFRSKCLALLQVISHFPRSWDDRRMGTFV